MSKQTNLHNEFAYKKRLLIEAEAELTHIRNRYDHLNEEQQAIFEPEMTRVQSWVNALQREVNDLHARVGTEMEPAEGDAPVIPKSPVAFPESVMSVLAPSRPIPNKETTVTPIFPEEKREVPAEPYYIAIVQNARRKPDVIGQAIPDYIFVGAASDQTLFVYEHNVGETIPEPIKRALRFDLEAIRDISPWYLPFALLEKEVE